MKMSEMELEKLGKLVDEGTIEKNARNFNGTHFKNIIDLVLLVVKFKGDLTKLTKKENTKYNMYVKPLIN